MERITHGTFAVSFIRNGDVITAFTEIRKGSSSDGTALVQIWDSDAGSVTGATDWSSGHEEQQPWIYFHVRSANGYPVAVDSMSFAYNGTTLSFSGVNASTWTAASNDSRFAAKIIDGVWCIKIQGNLIAADVLGNKQLTYTVNYTSLGMSSSISGNVQIWLLSGQGSAVRMYLVTNYKELSLANPTATVTAYAILGTNFITLEGTSGYNIKWYHTDPEESANQISALPTASSISVTRDMIEGSDLIFAKLYYGQNPVVGAHISIKDVDDVYQVKYTPTSTTGNYVSMDHNAQYTLSLLKNLSPYSPTGGITWSSRIYNIHSEQMGSAISGSTITVTPDHCKYWELEDTNHEGPVGYADVDISTTATFND